MVNTGIFTYLLENLYHVFLIVGGFISLAVGIFIVTRAP